MTEPNGNIPMMPISGASAAGGITLRCFGPERLLMIMPKREQTGAPYKGSEKQGPQRELVCDVVVLEGGPVTFGGEANNRGGMDKPDTMIVDIEPSGWFVQNMIIRAPAMFFSLDSALPGQLNPHGSAVVGRIFQDANYRGAWKMRDNPTQAEIQKAHDWWARFAAGQHVNPVPRLIAGPPAQGAPQVSYVPPAQAGPPVAEQYGPMGGYAAPVNPAQPGWPTQPAAVVNPFAQPAPVAAPPAIPPAPAGTEAWWASVTDAQRQQYLQQFAPAAAAPTGY